MRNKVICKHCKKKLKVKITSVRGQYKNYKRVDYISGQKLVFYGGFTYCSEECANNDK